VALMRALLAVVAVLVLAPAAQAAEVRVPNLVGLSLAQANARLQQDHLTPEIGDRLELTQSGRTPTFALSRRARHVTAQNVAAGTKVRRGTLIAVATRGPRTHTLAFDVVGWSSIAFAGGTLTLGGLEKLGDCVQYDHALLAPPDKTGARLISVWVRDYGRRKPACDPRPTAFALRAPAGWTAATIGLGQEPDAPDPRFSRRQAIVKTSVMLEPDDQTIVARFGHGACDGVASASATADGVVKVVLGYPPDFDGNCTDQLLGGSVLIRLPAPVNPATRFTDAACGTPGNPPCYEG
jgi:hypothetical protein